MRAPRGSLAAWLAGEQACGLADRRSSPLSAELGQLGVAGGEARTAGAANRWPGR